MGAVGLIYVGAVLFVNGAMLLGWVEGRSAAPLNIFVGLLQVVTPTYLIFSANGNTDQILNASGLYLFGFTYLYVAFNLFMNLDGTGLGFFSLFVAVAAVGYSLANFFTLRDPVFGVIWLYWAFLWLLFYLLLGRNEEGLGRYTGAVAAVQGWVTGAVPAALLLLGYWGGNNAGLIATIFAVFGIVVFAALWVPLRPRGRTEPTTTDRTAAAT
ncbi:transporter [Pseudonocardia sulfidoxydans NBRC 16205]|uniref:Transporter n=1 Tax=Pseudonocardia sulfidoxydans NBRC 16205 TaxID=1223511 RepID=A0A511DKW3_9PSEU|nr:AmiS/UreI family transporter [Pseudonocardia sulfidoxydans]GEL25425.1 transporter [Pseudonocardia sulfidoxydans NBRC 16205]